MDASIFPESPFEPGHHVSPDNFKGREEDIVVPWNDIKVIGNETVLVDTELPAFLRDKSKKYN